MTHAAGNAAGLIARPEINVGARRADNRRAGVLPDHQAAERRLRRRAFDRQVGLDEERRPIGVQRPIDRDGAARRQANAFAADRLALVAEPGDAEEYERLVLAAQLLGLVAMLDHPLADALERHLLARHQVALDQDAADRRVGMAVMGRVVDAQDQAVLEPHPRRALDVDRERRDRILEPADFEMPAVERALLDLAAVEVRRDGAVRGAPADHALVGEGLAGPLGCGHEVGGPAVHRHGEVARIGSAGLRAIRAAGGLAVVQEPADAAAPDMPWSALFHAGADYRVRLAEIPELLVRLADELILETEGMPSGLQRRAMS